MQKLAATVLALVLSVPVLAVLPVPTADAAPVVNAEIVRDTWGVPHIYAEDAYSLFFANGYAQAQDRLAQMEILRHVGKGELASLTGPSGLALDLVTRRELYTHEERLQAFEDLDPYWQAAFQGFEDGVNEWIAEVRADPSKLPVEYPALAVAPVDWDVTDTIAIAQYLLDVFGRGSGGNEHENAQIWAELEATLGDRAAAYDALGDLVFVQRAPGTTYTTIKAGDAPAFTALPAEHAHALDDWPADQAEAIAAAEDAALVDDADYAVQEIAAALGWPFKWGSNAQLIDARYTASGQPILYGGPQMGYFAPMIPYELSLHGAGFDAVGMGIAGAPGVIIGRAGNISWTVTSGASDQVDLVAERLVGDDYHYEVDGEVLAMDCRVEQHLVRPGPADFVPSASPDWRPPLFDVVDQEVCRTIHGPVLYRAEGYAFASHRSYRGDEARSGTLWLQIGTIKTIEDFRALFADFKFTFNFNLAEAAKPADPDGRIAYFHVGAQPLRDERLDPRFPRPGWNSTYEWSGIAHLEDLPHVVDPASGYTVNWNNNPAIGWASGDTRELWGAIHRAELMEEELLPVLAAGNVTLAALEGVHERASTREPFADDLLPLFLGGAVASGNASAVDAITEWADAKFTYADANGDDVHDHAAFRLYELWRIEMQERVFADELGAFVRPLNFDPPTSDDPHAADHGQHNNKDAILVDAALGATSREWCDDLATPGLESCADVSAAAMAAALAMTTAACETPALAADENCTPQPEWSAPFPLRKSKFVALGAEPRHEIPMTNRPSFQHFYDWGLPEGPTRSRNVLPPGGSGHMNAADFALMQFHDNGCEFCPLPPHQRDQLQLYVDFDTKPLLYAKSDVLAHEESTTVFPR